MATKLTKKQAQALLDQYEKQQTAATEAAIAAYNKQVDAQTAADTEENRQKQAAATEKANIAYDAALISALADKYTIAEQVASRGLSRSGAATAAAAATEHRRALRQQAARATETDALAQLQANLLSAGRTAQAKKTANAATARKTLAGKVAEKRLTLMKNTEG